MLNRLIAPRSIAVIGASAHPEKVGHQILKNIISGGYQGDVYPINPKGGEILGLSASIELAEVPGDIDMAVIAIPAAFVEEVVRECVGKGVKSIVIISAGFAEVGTDGAAAQEKIAQICKEHNILLLGPNCLGLINTGLNLNATFARTMPRPGNVSFISQSGATITSLIDWSLSSSVGFGKIFSLGNKALLEEADFLEYLYKDDDTNVIIGYLENLAVTEKLTEVLRTHSKTKPTIMLFGGKSDYGKRAAQSHTGALISSYLSIKTYLTQAGVIIADTLEDLLLYTRIFSYRQKISGDRFAIVTNAGGLGVVASDELFKLGLKLPPLGEEAQKKLKTELRAEANVTNPIDVLGDATEKEYQSAISAAVGDPSIDGIITLLTPQSATNIPEITEVIAAYRDAKPMIAAYIGGESLMASRVKIEQGGKPCFNFPEEATRGYEALTRFSRLKANLLDDEVEKKIFHPEKKAEHMLEFNLPILEYASANTIADLNEFAQKNGFPVVLKTTDPNIVHKSDAGGVKLGIKNKTELKAAFKALGGKSVAIGRMIAGEREIFIGAKKDPRVGTVMAFGTGGIFAELMGDFSYRLAPISKEMAHEMIRETKMGQILLGARGQKKYDIDKIAEIVEATARFVMSFSNIVEVDFNPVLAAGDDFYIVDARIVANE